MTAGTAQAARTSARRRPAWTDAHVERLLWRAGFGPAAGEIDRLQALGKPAALGVVLDGDGPTTLKGPPPTVNGQPLDPENQFDHDVLWWLDRMVRSTHGLEERMTWFWHDHFATSGQDTPLMLAQNRTLRRYALGTFDDLLRAVFLDPAMQLALSIAGSAKEDPNENFARELMELYTLGVGNGYTEDDVREIARALTGWVAVTANGRVTGVRFDPSRHDDGIKTIFGKRGAWGWEDVLRLVLAHKGVAEFLTDKLWAEFVGTPLDKQRRRKLVRQFQHSGRSIRTLVGAILRAPQLYDRLDEPDMVKSPVVMVAGLLRVNGWGVDRTSWADWLTLMGQRPFAPPSVAGWDGGSAWCSTTGFRTRFVIATEVLDAKKGLQPVASGSVPITLDPAGHLALAKRALGDPFTTRDTDHELRTVAAQILGRPAKYNADKRKNAEQTQRALRTLLIAGPDAQLI